ncbi:MAG: DUF4249 domain-containing protein [Flavobacteriales bacterium]|nr:DUF4249 domain-containing protein [Flavobacteriales bacterium]
MKKWILLLLPIALLSCEDVVELELPEGEPLLVIDGQITNQPGKTRVLLTESVPYFDEVGNPPVEGAIIELFEDGASVGTFTELDSGLYVSAYTGITGKSYHIEIELSDGSTYASEQELLTRVPPIDSVYYRYETDLQFLEDGYYVYFATQELPGKPEFYRWKYYFNGIYQNTRFDINIANDDFVDGNYVVDFAVNFEPFFVGDSVEIEQYSTTRDYYDYWILIGTQVSQVGSPFDPPPAPVVGNMICTDDANETVLGYFSAHGLARGSVIVQE